MEVSQLALRVVLLFFPGIIAALVIDALTNHRERSPFIFGTHAFVLGLSSYLILALFRAILNIIGGLAGASGNVIEDLTFFRALTDDKVLIAWFEILLAAVAACVLAAAVSAAVNHKVLHRVAQWLRVSRRSGELDVWALLFNSDETGWINVRDPQRDLTYEGWVDAFSDTAASPEVLMQDVAVYRNSTGELLYRTPRVYLSLIGQQLIIEYPPSQG